MLSKETLFVLLLTILISKSLQLTVDCEYKLTQKWKSVEDSYGCFLTKLDVKRKFLVTNVTGTHLDEKTNSDVKALKIIGGCEIIPSGFDAIFPNIEAFSVWKSNLETVTSTDLQQFSNLREIWLYVTKLNYLESTLFQYNPKVEVINFNANSIKYIGGDFFNYLPNLRMAFFVYNDCIDGEAKDSTKLSVMKDEIKKKCAVKKLQLTVDCEYKISHGWKVVKDSYGCFMTTLDIKTKLIVTNTTGTHLYGSTNSDVKVFNIYGGICEIIPSDIGLIFPNIEAVSIWNATLKIISNKDLQQFSNLREIWLYDNDFDYVESKLFQYNPKVEVVVFKNNKIKYIGGSFFDYLPNLQSADFFYNDCINDDATDAAKLDVIKGVIEQKCAVPGKEPRGYTTILPDGLTYWVNSTDDEGGEGFGASPALLRSLVG